MATRTLFGWGGLALIATGLLFALGSVLLVVLPFGSPVGPLLHVIGFVVSVPAYIALYAVQAHVAGRLGLVGFVLGVIGAGLYNIPVFLVFAGAAGVETWHDAYVFASPLLVVGALAFLLGSFLLGIATMRVSILPRWAGLLLAIGSILWLIAFWVSAAGFLLQVGTTIGGVGLVWLGWTLWSGKSEITQPPHLTTPPDAAV